MSQVVENGLAVLKFSRRNLLAFAEDIPTDKLCHQPSAGANHAMWVLGHTAWTDDFFLTKLGQKQSGLDAKWTQQFGQGSKPSSDAASYPSLAEVKDVMNSTRERLHEWFSTMSEKQLSAPLPDDFKGFAPNFGALMNSIAWHEGLHSGQLTACRRALGIGPKHM